MVFIKSLGDLDTVGSEFNQDEFEIPVNRDPNLRGKNKNKIDMTCVILIRALRYKLFFVKALTKRLRKLTIITKRL